MSVSTPHLLRRCLPVAAAAAMLLVLGGCQTAPVQPDPTQVKLNDLEQRVGRIERVINNQSLVQLSQRLDQLDMELRDLRGTVEELQNNDDMLGKQERDFYSDLDRRLDKLEVAQKAGQAAAAAAAAGSVAADTGGSAPATATANPVTYEAAYQSAFDTLKSAHYADAVKQFSDYLRHYPNSPLADNAQYWLGESYYVTRDYRDAAAAFRAVGERYPNSRKAPDALLKLGYTQYDQQQLADARATLRQVVQRFPGSAAAKLATERLAQIPAGKAKAPPPKHKSAPTHTTPGAQ